MAKKLRQVDKEDELLRKLDTEDIVLAGHLSRMTETQGWQLLLTRLSEIENEMAVSSLMDKDADLAEVRGRLKGMQFVREFVGTAIQRGEDALRRQREAQEASAYALEATRSPGALVGD